MQFNVLLSVGHRTMVHFRPSSSFLGGFLTRILSGLGFLPGTGLFAREYVSDTIDPARREGFLCVISDLSTFRRPFVTASPWFRAEKTAPNPPGVATGVESIFKSTTGAGPGGGGGGGGGGAEP